MAKKESKEFPVVHPGPRTPKTKPEAEEFIGKYGYSDIPGHPKWEPPKPDCGGRRRERPPRPSSWHG